MLQSVCPGCGAPLAAETRPHELAGCLMDIASVHRKKKDLAEADRALALAASLVTRLLETSSPLRGQLDLCRAELALAHGDASAAEALFRASPSANAQVGMARVLRAKGDEKAARAALDELVRSTAARYGVGSAELARMLVKQSAFLEDGGDRPAVRAVLERALALREKLLGRDNPSVARTRAHLSKMAD